MESATYPFFELLRLFNARPPVTPHWRWWHTARGQLVVPFDHQISLRSVGRRHTICVTARLESSRIDHRYGGRTCCLHHM